jgi:3-hydroxybutyryl-CoA dehydrogenase
MLMPLIQEAARALEEGVASAEDIDQALKLGANFPMGPLHLADLIGLDVVVHELEALAAQLGAHHAPCAELRRRLGRGELGRKTGKGFFAYGPPR